ncbi:MAG TPA: aspartate aminotransferase family protein [Candidatus Acidoferrales bacterium]|nr:aspartate aminotransferase family protein [Candidatus Acidoferrales bacterium]
MQELSYAEAPRIVVKPPGPKSKELISKQSVLETRAVIYSKAFPIGIDSAKGATVKDVDGNVFIDWISGICVINLGHNNPYITSAVQSQLGKIWHALEIPTEARINFLEKIHSVLPGKLRGNAKAMLTVTGGDACEAAISLAKHITGRNTIIAFGGSYHGIHQGIVSLTSSRHYLESSHTLRYGVFHLPYPYSYRFPFDVQKKGDESKVVLRYLESCLVDEHSGLDNPAGILVEPIQGEGGYIVPPDDFLPGLREIADKFQIPLIIDEVQTGFGRTGKFWGCELTNTSPDIMCVSKSVGAGLPLSMIAYKKEYDEKVPDAFHLGTYRGNPLAMVAGAASIDYIKNEKVLDHVTRLGQKAKAAFERTAESSKSVGDVRGAGFMVGNEMVESKQTKAPSKQAAVAARKEMLENGLLMHTCGHYGNVLRFMAPLIISEDLLNKSLEIYDRAIRKSLT